MSDKTTIEWTDATWNPVTGCTRVSPGCTNCYVDWSPPFRIEGRPRTWDTLHDTDKAACMAFAVPMADAALAALDFTEHTA